MTGNYGLSLQLTLSEARVPLDGCLAAMYSFSLLMNRYGGKEVDFDFGTGTDVSKVLGTVSLRKVSNPSTAAEGALVAIT